MKNAYNLISFIKMYYLDSNLPMYLFSNEKCIFCMSEQTNLTYPPAKYLQELFASEDRIAHCTTEYGIIFCSLKLNYPENGFLVFGPVTNVPYTDSDLQHLYKDYTVPNTSYADFNQFLRKIPCIALSSLLMKCIFLNYCLHEEVLSIEQLTTANQLSFEADPTADASLLIKGNYQKNENEQHNQTYAIEEQILKFVRTGDPDLFLFH